MSMCRMLLAGLLFAVAGCQGDNEATTPAEQATARSGPLEVTATIGMIADVAREVGGEHVNVTGLMGPGVDPHLYKATQSDLDKLRNADVILYNGLYLEGRMADILVRMASRVPTVQVTDTIAEADLKQPPAFDGHYDPHVWFDVSLWMQVVERIRDAFIELDPDNTAAYTANTAAYLEEMAAMHAYAAEQIAQIPEAARVLITAHDAFGYFGEAYGLDVMGLQGISTASEFGLQDLERLIDVIVEREVKAVFIETSIPRKSIEALIEGVRARGHDIGVGGALYSDAMGEPGSGAGTYLGMVRHNVDTIVEALK